jgi:exonuclease VII large subunit
MTEPAARVALLLTLMRQLQEVIRTENALLREMKLTRLQELQAEKTALAGSYEVELRRLRRDPELLGALDPESRALLDAAMRELQATLRSSADRLLQAKQVAEGIVQALGASFTAPGTLGRGYAAAENATGRVIAVAFDRRC